VLAAGKHNVLKYIPQFNSVIVCVSLDGVGKYNDYIRRRSNYKTIKENMETFDKYPNVQVDLNSTVTFFSVLHLYKFADIAYIGGGMGDSGLHNILEAAVFAIPVIIGKNYKGFAEAEKLVKLGGVKSVNSKLEFDDIFNNLISDKTDRIKMGEINKKYIYSNSGGSKTIIKALTKSLN
jgi:3-deoxy-D-manno-octulosonic-acid transferase